MKIDELIEELEEVKEEHGNLEVKTHKMRNYLVDDKITISEKLKQVSIRAGSGD